MELKLGKNKIIDIKPWKTKTKKDFLNIIKKKGKEISENDILDTLILPYVEPNNIYFSDEEIQWILVNIRNISANNDMKFLIECSNCKKDITISCKLLDLCEYKENEYPIIKNEKAWIDLDDSKSLKDNIKKYDEFPKNIEMLMHLESVGNKKFSNMDEKIEYFENLSLEDNDKLVDEYKEVKSDIELKYKTKCPKCEYETTYVFEEIPNFFDPILPKEI
jgi:hypothetical protein